MGNLNITLEGYVQKVIEYMVKKGYAKSKTEAIRLALRDQHNLEERLKRLEEAAGITASQNEPKGKKQTSHEAS